MKKTLFALSALSIILVGCNGEEKTAEVAAPAPAEMQQEVQPEVTPETTTVESQTDLLAQTEDLATIEPTEVEVVDVDNLNTEEWQGTYHGIQPCADCEGIEVNLTLNQDETYQMEESYLGKEDSTFQSTGAVQWDETGTIITLVNDDGSEPVKYTLQGDSLAKLDVDGEPLTGKVASLYQLTKEK